MKIVPTTGQIEEAIRQLSIPGNDDGLAEKLASSAGFVSFTSELFRQMAEGLAAKRFTPEQMCAALMQAYIRIGIHIGVAMVPPPRKPLKKS